MSQARQGGTISDNRHRFSGAGPMPRIIINGEEVRNPLLRFVLLAVAATLVAVLLASAAAWLLILFGLGTAVALAAFVLALLVAAIALPWAMFSALLRRRGGRR